MEAPMSDPVVVRGLTKTFYDEARGEVHAVRGVDFECRAGEIFGLLGANGAGKTTTLRMLSTIFFSWIITIPVAAVLATVFYFTLLAVFGG